jgi:GDP-D-mannose dehydratase
VDGLGSLRMLEVIRVASPEARIYQASTSEMFGKVVETPQKRRPSIPAARMAWRSFSPIGRSSMTCSP